MEEIDAAVHRVLMLKERLGLFDDPYRRGGKPETPAALANRRRVARDVSARSIVMLKNEGDTLPLGRCRNNRRNRPARRCARGNGRSRGEPLRMLKVTLRYSRVCATPWSGTQILHEAGVDIQSDDDHGYPGRGRAL